MNKNFAAALLLTTTVSAQGVLANETLVKVIAFNDFHGNLHSAGNVDGVPMGGVDVLAAYVDALKAQNPFNVVVSAGDLIGASPLVSAMFHDEPTIEAMNRLRLDFNAVGNHEFDEGPVELLRMQQGGCHPEDINTCKGELVGTPVPFEGAQFDFLAANVLVQESGETLFPSYGIKNFGGHDMAFIGLTLEGTPGVTLTSGVTGLSFLDEADTINALVPHLRSRGIEAIVVLIHEGGLRSSAPGSINDCMADVADSTLHMPIRDIVNRLDDAVDLVIAGHSSIAFNCMVPNSAGRPIPVTHAQGAGMVLSDIDLVLDATGDVIEVSVRNVLVEHTDAVVPHQEIARLVHAYSQLAAVHANKAIGAIAAPLTRERDADSGQSDAGSLIADSQLFATRNPDAGGARIALMNTGGVRSALTTDNYPGNVTFESAYRMQPFSNYLVTLTYTGAQLKDILEQQFPGCRGRESSQLLQISIGFTYSWRNSAPACEKIVEAALDGVPLIKDSQLLDPDAQYRITVNNFLAEGGDGFSTLTAGTERITSMLDMEALMSYLSQYSTAASTTASPYNADAENLGKPRVLRLP